MPFLLPNQQHQSTQGNSSTNGSTGENSMTSSLRVTLIFQNSMTHSRKKDPNDGQ